MDLCVCPSCTDIDDDGVADAGDSAPNDPLVCADSDSDGCDDCSGGTFDPWADGLDAEGDGLCDAADLDDDNDGRSDLDDTSPFDPSYCGDLQWIPRYAATGTATL